MLITIIDNLILEKNMYPELYDYRLQLYNNRMHFRVNKIDRI